MTGRIRNKCDVCGRKKPTSPCELCASLIRGAPKTAWDFKIPEMLHNEVAVALGGPHPNTKQRWKALQRAYESSEDVHWARLPEASDPVLEPPASEQEITAVIDHIEQGFKLSSEERLILHRGFLMHDGLHFSFQDDTVSMNGRKLPCAVPTVSLLRVLSSPKIRVGWDLSKLLIVFGCSNPVALPEAMPGNNDQRRGQDNFYQRRRLLRRVNQPSKHAVNGLLTWVGWMAEEHIPPPRNHILHPLAAWARDIRQRLETRAGFDGNIVEAFLNHPPALEELNTYPWLQRWKNYRGTQQGNAPVKWPLRITGSKLKLRVRTKKGTSLHTNVPENPAIWALLLSLALSPVTSHSGETMFAIQHDWTSLGATPTHVAPPLKRSIEFLNDIIEGSGGRAFVHQKHILVVGRLGHFYEVSVGRGVHGAPFMIRIIGSLLPRRTTSVCIHQGNFHTSVPLGDTMASVVLTLLDDVGSTRQIPPLLEYLGHQSPLGFPRVLDESHLALLDEGAVSQLKQVLQSLNGMVAPSWLKEFRDQYHEVDNEVVPPGNRRHFRYLEHRNRHNQQNYIPVNGQAGGASTLVEHAVAAKRPVPIQAMAEMWGKSLAFLLEESKEVVADEGRAGNYIDDFQRNDWMFLRNHGQPEIAGVIGDIRNGERRFCEVFPRLWEAMLLQPIGSNLRFDAADGGELQFEHCMLNVTLRNGAERRLVRSFATLLGYVEEDHEQGRIIYLRRDHPRQWARRNLSESLNRAQERFGLRGAPPWWWHYMDVQQAPEAVPEFRWELGIDLRDNPGPRMEGDFQP